jgi:hypothetical protein
MLDSTSENLFLHSIGAETRGRDYEVMLGKVASKKPASSQRKTDPMNRFNSIYNVKQSKSPLQIA